MGGWTSLATSFIPSIGDEADILYLLFATTVGIPLMSRIKTSPIIGFLLIGLLLGPSGLNLLKNYELTHKMADLGIVFFLFEIGLELSIGKVVSMRSDVFGLGSAQYIGTALIIAVVASVLVPSLPSGALGVLGGGLALSSSAFALQLLRDSGQVGTRYGRASFGVLLFQDLAVVPLLVMLPLLGGGASGTGPGLATALWQALIKATVALGIICLAGQVFIRRLFYWVKRSKSTEAFLAATLGVVLLSSKITEGLGLSDTLGAFVGGVLVAETNYRHQVEADIAPFRGMLLGLFFVTVGFSLNLKLLASTWTTVLPLLLGLLALKAAVVMVCARFLFGHSGASAMQVAALLAPGGEFAFVVFGIAERLELIPTPLASVLVTITVLSMGLTPLLASISAKAAERIRSRRGSDNVVGLDRHSEVDLKDIKKNPQGFVLVCGYTAIGRAVCDLLDAEGRAQYIVFEDDPIISAHARSKGLPVYLVDCTRRAVLQNFKIGEARLVVITMPRRRADKAAAAIRRLYPKVRIVVKAQDDAHKKWLENTYRVSAVVPRLISVRFGGSVLKKLGYDEPEVECLMDLLRRRIYSEEDEPEVDLGRDSLLPA